MVPRLPCDRHRRRYRPHTRPGSQRVSLVLRRPLRRIMSPQRTASLDRAAAVRRVQDPGLACDNAITQVSRDWASTCRVLNNGKLLGHWAQNERWFMAALDGGFPGTSLGKAGIASNCRAVSRAMWRFCVGLPVLSMTMHVRAAFCYYPTIPPSHASALRNPRFESLQNSTRTV